MKTRLFIVFYCVVCAYIQFGQTIKNDKTFYSFDISGYHLYLPALFIYNDVAHLSFYPKIDSVYRPTGDITWYSIYTQSNGRKLNKYAIGSSIMESPFFAIAHAYTSATETNPADGYSKPYQLATGLSNIFWCFAGLVCIYQLLRRYFSESVVFLAMACITLGTNLFLQLTLWSGSHVYSFFLVAATLYLTERWHATSQNKYVYLLGLALGLTIIVRPVNVLIVIVPLLWNVYDLKSFKKQLTLISSKTLPILGAAAIFFALAGIQMAYWKYITGHWLYFSYQGERFNFREPHIWNGLFSYRKGWFVYTPMAIMAVAGFYMLRKQHKKLVLPLALFLMIMIYVVFSWTNWWYGGGFGSRVMVDFLPVLSLPLAAFIHYIYRNRYTAVKAMTAIVMLFLISLNLFQTWQYSIGIIPSDRVTKTYYWKVFGKTYYKEEDFQYLMSDKEYWDGMRKAYD